MPHPMPFLSVLCEPGLAVSLFPHQFLDANDCHLDFMSAMTTTCIGGEIFSRIYMFQISADCKVLPQEQMLKMIKLSGTLESGATTFFVGGTDSNLLLKVKLRDCIPRCAFIVI
jgi:hypothetical protein